MHVQLLTLALSVVLTTSSIPTSTCFHPGLNGQPGINLNLSFINGYVTNISIGTPPQPFQFAISSRDQEFWVRSSNCSKNCERYPKYNASLSSTFKRDGRHVFPKYFEQEGQLGYLSIDTVSIGEGKLENVSFGEINNVFASFYEKTEVAGALGLGFKPNLPFDFFVDDLLQFTCIHKVGAFYLKRVKFSDEIRFVKDAGYVTLGSPFGDRSLYDGDINWVKGIETSNGDQLVPVKGITAGNMSLCHGKCEAHIDTTQLLIALPGSSSFELNIGFGFTQWLGSGYVAQCSRRNSLPNVTFDIGGFNVSLTPQDYLIDITNDDDPEKVCLSAFYANQEGSFVLGRPFLIGVYTLLDYDQKRFGFASFKREAMKYGD